MIKKLNFVSAIILSFTLFGVTASGVSASGYNQNETCTGAYGQVVKCGAVKGATDSGKVIYLADTALDTSSLLLVSSILLSGVGAVVLKKKLS